MIEPNSNIPSNKGVSANFLAEIAGEIGEALINNPQLKSSMIEHAEKVIQKAEEYGQYLRTEWQKAKEAGLTQHDENKDNGKWSWWTAYSKDWSRGKGVYFDSNESMDVQFYIEGKPKPDPLSYLSSMIWGSVAEDYNGLELLDEQFVLLAIIHDAQNWQAGRERIHFNPLEIRTLPDRLCRAVWHHLKSKIDSYGFGDVKNTIITALQTIKAQHASREINRNALEPEKEKGEHKDKGDLAETEQAKLAAEKPAEKRDENKAISTPNDKSRKIFGDKFVVWGLSINYKNSWHKIKNWPCVARGIRKIRKLFKR